MAMGEGEAIARKRVMLVHMHTTMAMGRVMMVMVMLVMLVVEGLGGMRRQRRWHLPWSGWTWARGASSCARKRG